MKKSITKEDAEYWNSYYKTGEALTAPSDFAQYVNSKLSRASVVLDVGCGNGRDSTYFHESGHTVLALDNSIEGLNCITDSSSGEIPTICCDISKLKIAKNFVDVAYSRFSLHSLDEDSYERALKVIYQTLNPGGLFCIEVRSIEDELFGEGNDLGGNVFKTDHSRRFFTLDSIVSDLTSAGFTIDYADCQRGWAVYKQSDPKVIRIICVK